MKHLILAAAAALALGAAEAGQERWQDHYRTYDQAIAVGDAEAAEAAARQAWLITRQAMEDSDTRALLAHNYAELAVAGDLEAAEVVLLDAIALGEKGFGNENLAVPTLRFMLAEVRSAAEPRDRDLAQAAAEAARSLPLGQELLNPIITQRVRLALTLQGREDYLLMGEVGGDLSDDFAEAEGVPPHMALEAETLRALAVLNVPPRSPAFRQYSAARNIRRARFAAYGPRLERSYARFIEIANSIGSQPNIADFDVTFARASAWSSLMYSFILSYEIERTDISSSVHRVPYVVIDGNCEGAYEWKRRPVDIPDGAVGTNGAVLVGFHISSEGRVEDARVLGEIPAARFGESILRYMRSWRADIAEDAPPQCLRNQVRSTLFYNPPG